MFATVEWAPPEHAKQLAIQIEQAIGNRHGATRIRLVAP